MEEAELRAEPELLALPVGPRELLTQPVTVRLPLPLREPEAEAEPLTLPRELAELERQADTELLLQAEREPVGEPLLLTVTVLDPEAEPLMERLPVPELQ